MTPRPSGKTLLLGSILLTGAGTCFILHSAKGPPDGGPPTQPQLATSTRSKAPGITREPEEAAVEDLLAELHALTKKEQTLDFQALQEAIQSLVRIDPQAAADLATSLPDGTPREIALHRLAQAWATRHPEAAADWASAIRNQEERGALLNGIFGELAQTDPAKAVQMAETYDMLSFSPGMTGNLVQQWAARDFDSALRWTGEQPAGAARDEMFLRLALVRSTTAPEEAARMVSERIAPGSVQEEAAITIVSRWAPIDVEAARSWANTFAAGNFRERALNEINLAATAIPANKPGD